MTYTFYNSCVDKHAYSLSVVTSVIALLFYQAISFTEFGAKYNNVSSIIDLHLLYGENIYCIKLQLCSLYNG